MSVIYWCWTDCKHRLQAMARLWQGSAVTGSYTITSDVIVHIHTRPCPFIVDLLYLCYRMQVDKLYLITTIIIIFTCPLQLLVDCIQLFLLHALFISCLTAQFGCTEQSMLVYTMTQYVLFGAVLHLSIT